jgi:pimeloyl-ACP methyl ester carboxylesterase
VRLHYVTGGEGRPVVLLPGWPQTWWAFHKIMPALARDRRVIAVDLRGMGGSDKPAGGYDKKTMAKDIAELVRVLGYDKVDVVGHDIGAQVAFSFAANHPEATRKLVLLDVPHPDANLAKWPLLPTVGTFGDRIFDGQAYAWWFAFHQVKGLPEDLLAGRHHIEQAWFFRYLLKDESAIDARDRAVYAAAYASRDAIRAGNAWYQAFPQDIVDDGTYGKLAMPVLGLGGPGYDWLKATLEAKATDLRVIKVEDSGHFIAEEKPEDTLAYLTEFLK